MTNRFRSISLASLFLAFGFTAAAGGYEIGDKAADFRLQNVDGRMLSLADFPDTKGFIVVFTCNHCPVSVAYEDRIISIDRKYRDKGYPVIAINPNDPEVQPEDSYENMQERAKEKRFPFPYLLDEGQSVYPRFGAARTPHAFVLRREGTDLVVRYMGAIDNNQNEPEEVTSRYLEQAVDALIAGQLPEKAVTKAVGCTIKKKK